MIGECNRLGMIVDGAHVSHEGIRRVLDVSEAPILLSHSNAFSLCDHPRNAPDDVLRRLKDERRRRHGDLRARLRLAGLARLAQALARRLRQGAARRRSQGPARRAGDAPRPGAARHAEEVADHIVYLVETAGIDHVGIGSDFFGGAQPVGLEHVGRFPHLFAELIRRGFSERDLTKIASRNVLRVMREVERVGEALREAREPAIGRIEDYPGA